MVCLHQTEFPTGDAAANRAMTPSIMSIRNKPAPIDTHGNVPEFEWAHNLKPNPKRSAVKFGLALAAFAVAAWLLSLDVGLSTRYMLRYKPVLYRQDTAITADNAAALQVSVVCHFTSSRSCSLTYTRMRMRLTDACTGWQSCCGCRYTVQHNQCADLMCSVNCVLC